MADESEKCGPDEKPRKKPATSAVVQQRIDAILQLRLNGAQFHDLVQYGSSRGWNVSARMVGKYIQKADALLVERLDKKRKPVIARHLAQRQYLFAKALKDGDLRTALATLDSEAKLRGLFPEANVKDLLKLLAAQGEELKKLEGDQHAVDGGSGSAGDSTASRSHPPTVPPKK